MTRFLALAAMVFGLWLGTAPAASAASLLATNISVSNADIAAAAQRQGFSQSMAQAAANASSNVENRGGQLGLFNGSCCTGVMQVNMSNLQRYCGCTSAQYAAMSLDQQMEVWGRLTRAAMNSQAIREADKLTTFDGQPVDDAFKLACVQLGIGYCRGMLASGSCSGGTGGDPSTNVCKYALKTRQGPGQIGNTGTPQQGTANSANDSGAATQQDVNGRGINGDSIAMGDPIYCWSCDAILYSLAAAEAAISDGLPAMVDSLWPLFLITAAIGILYRMLIAVVAGINPIRYAGTTAMRATFILLLLSHGGAVVQSLLLEDLLVPSLNTGAQLGDFMGGTIAQAFNLPLDNITPLQGASTTPTNGNCTFGAARNITITYLKSTEAAALSLACTIHRAMTTEIQIGVFLANSNKNASTGMQKAAAIAMNVAGLLMTAVGVIGLLKFGLIYMDVVIAMAVAIVFAPWSLFSWIFDSTRRSFGGFWRRFLHAFVSLLMAGIACTASIIMLLTAMQTGLGLPPPLSASAILINAQQLVQSMDVNTPQSMGPALRFLMFTIGGAIASNHILAQSQHLVSIITGLQVSSTLSRALFSGLSSAVGVGLGFGAGALGAVSGPLGRAASRLGGRLLAQ